MLAVTSSAQLDTVDEPFGALPSTQRLMNYARLPSSASQQSTPRRAVLTPWFAALMCSVAFSCGDDSGDNPKSDAGIAGTSGKGGAGGVGGGAAGAPAPVECGSSKCTPQPNPLTALLGTFGMGAPVAGLPAPVACCVDEANGTCGTAAMEGAACEVIATPDTRCPSIGLGGLGAAAGGAAAGLGNLAAGCCTPSGACGLDGALFGRGCVENSEVKAMLGAIPIVGTLLTVPPALACDRPIDVNDAGAADAGN
jgi:hypothetical protein